MSAIEFLQDLKVLEGRAKAFPVRRSDKELYGLLAAALHMSNRAEREGLVPELKEEVVQRAKSRGAKRPHFQGDTDGPLVVCRLLFEGDKGREASWRYTATLRRATEKQIRPSDLVEWLTTNGGINALFKTRDVEKRTRMTKTLHLLDSVELPKTGEFTITLRDNGAGFYHVISTGEET